MAVKSYYRLILSFLISFGATLVQNEQVLGQEIGPQTVASQSAIYLGIGGDYTKIKDSASSQLSLFLGRYFASDSQLVLGFQTDVSWFNQQDLYDLGAELGLLAEWRFNNYATRPFVLIGGGVNAESIGAFHVSRFPMGPTLGLRLPVLEKGFFQLDYKYRYIFNDPIEAFTIHRLSVGAAILLN